MAAGPVRVAGAGRGDDAVTGVPGRIRRTHDWLWRWSAVIDTGDPSTRWSARTWTLRGARAKALRAEKRIGMTVEWSVRL